MKDYSLSLFAPKVRFWARVIKSRAGCWKWLGDIVPQKSSPYGRMFWEGRTRLAHVISWYLHKGSWPEGMVCHTCDNSLCVNPDHLYIGNAKTNMADRSERGRVARGEGNAKSVLSNIQVQEIRTKYTLEDNFEDIGRAYNVSGVTVANILRYKTWKHL